MSTADRPLKRERIGEPVEFPAPPPELMAQLRALLPPVQAVPVKVEPKPLRRAS